MIEVLGNVLLWMLILSDADAAYVRGVPRKLDSLTLAHLMTPMAGEPTCDDLRLMWRFSRRQNRVAEITNEIPTYRDPFAFNVWEHVPRPKEMVGTLRSGGRSWNRPIFGRLVQNAPKNHPRLANIESYEELLRYLGNTNVGDIRLKGPGSAFRLTGGMPRPSALSQMGSFQHLKQLIWAEREKELQEQRLVEEAAARSVALKDVNLPTNFNRGYSYGAKQLYQGQFDGDQGRFIAGERRFSPELGRLASDGGQFASEQEQYQNEQARFTSGQGRFSNGIAATLRGPMRFNQGKYPTAPNPYIARLRSHMRKSYRYRPVPATEDTEGRW